MERRRTKRGKTYDDDDDDDLFEAPVSMLPMLMAHKKKKKWTSIYKFVKTSEVRSVQVLKQMRLQATAKRQFEIDTTVLSRP